MIDLTGDISIPFLKKSRFTGSYLGMRYMLRKQERVLKDAVGEEPAKTENVIEAVIWPEPLNYEMTAEDKKHSKDFSFDPMGIKDAITWLNAEYEAGHY